jgi:ABC-type multidrug transport system fused ATPase/permease subunit
LRGNLFGRLLARAYRGAAPLRRNEAALAVLVALGVALGVVRGVCESRARLALNRVAVETTTRLRRSVHRQTLRLGPSDLEGRSSEQAYHLFTAEIDRIGDGVTLLASRLGRDPVRLAVLGALALAIDWKLAIECALPVIVCWLASERERRSTRQLQELTRAQGEHDLRLLGENLEKTRLIRGFQMENFEQEQFHKALERYQQSTAGVLEARTWSRRAVRGFIVVCAALVVLFLGWSVLMPAQETSLAAGAVLLAAFSLMWVPLANLTRLRADLEPASAAAQHLEQYLNRIPEVGQAVGARFLQPLSKLLVFENVSYATPGRRQLLDGLNLRIPAGRQVALVGTAPLETLAIAYLLPRFIEPQQGRITIDGEDIAWVTLESLRAETIFVGGKDPTLHATVRENISGGLPNYSLQEVTEAAKIAHAHNFIQRLPQGYETILGGRGEQLDAGQAFRLGLARAILRKPALLIIEEPDGPLDDDSKTMLDDAYKRITPNRTVIFVPKRLSTVRRCDEIILVHRGRLAAIGPHARLVQTSPLYRHWEYLNFNEFRSEFEAG